jgi:hypothetical protein
MSQREGEIGREREREEKDNSIRNDQHILHLVFSNLEGAPVLPCCSAFRLLF